MIDRACISINSRCNMSCGYCHFGKNVNPNNSDNFELNSHDVTTLINNISKYAQYNKIKSFKLGIVGSGEPMLSFSTIKYILDYSVENHIKNITFYTITNGTILSSEHLNYLYDKKSIISLCFSLDGYKELHELSRPNYDLTFNNILKYENKFGEKPIINFVVTRNTLVNKDRVIDFLIDNKFHKVNFSIVFGSIDEKIQITRKEYYNFLNECKGKGIITRQTNGDLKRDCTKYGNLCGVGVTNIYITKQGVFPCGRFQGNKKYLIGELTDNLFTIENNLLLYKPVDDDSCYFEKHEVCMK